MSIKTKNPAAVEVVANDALVNDENAFPVKIMSGGGGPGGGGTEYVEDAAAPANPAGPMTMAVRKDTLSTTEVSADGDIVAVKATSKGQLHVYAEVANLTPGGATEAKQDDIIAGQVDIVDAINNITIPAPTGGATETTQLGVRAAVEAIQAVTEDPAPVQVELSQTSYEFVSASSTDAILGSTGAVGNYLGGLLVIPSSTSPGAVIVKDGATTMTVFAGGANSVNGLYSWFIPLGIKSVNAGWSVTTGTNVSVIGVGKFS